MKKSVIAILIVLFFSVLGFSDNLWAADAWTFVYGDLRYPEMQQKYLTNVQETVEYFKKGLNLQNVSMMKESDFSMSLASGGVFFLGPVEAFSNLSVMELPFEILQGKKLKIDNLLFESRQTGFFCRNQAGSRFVYSGLSYEGYLDIFRIPTGQDALTVIVDGAEEVFGNYVGEKMKVEATNFSTRFPSKAEVEDLSIPENSLQTKALFDEMPASLNSGMDDLKWLQEKVQGMKVCFFGESHWSKKMHVLARNIILYLAQNCRLGAVFLELDYSRSGFYNYYIHLKDDGEARDFFSKSLDYLVPYEDTEELLVFLRDWNINHPDHTILIGGNDLEWGTSATLNRILQPYFLKLDPAFNFSYPENKKQWDEMISRMRSLLALAKEKNLIGDYPFITPAYMETVVENLASTVECRLAGDNWSAVRQKAFIRNTVDPKYNGKAFDTPLVFIHGGGWHARKDEIDETDNMPDATYLNHFFDKTKGKVYSLASEYLTMNFQPIECVDFEKYFTSGTTYNQLVERFHKYASLGKADPQAYYFCWNPVPTVFNFLLCKEGYRMGANCLKIEKIDWEALQKVYGDKLSDDMAFVRTYDDVIYILKSPIIKTRLIPIPAKPLVVAESRIPRMRIELDSRPRKPSILFNRFSTEKQLKAPVISPTKETPGDIFSHPRFR